MLNSHEFPITLQIWVVAQEIFSFVLVFQVLLSLLGCYLGSHIPEISGVQHHDHIEDTVLQHFPSLLALNSYSASSSSYELSLGYKVYVLEVSFETEKSVVNHYLNVFLKEILKQNGCKTI